jgi:hypothetical protein
MTTISSVQSISTASSSSADSTKAIAQKIKALQQQITAEQQSQDDAKTKQMKIQLLEQEILMLEMQQQQQQQNAQNQTGNNQSSINTSSHTVDIYAWLLQQRLRPVVKGKITMICGTKRKAYIAILAHDPLLLSASESVFLQPSTKVWNRQGELSCFGEQNTDFGNTISNQAAVYSVFHARIGCTCVWSCISRAEKFTVESAA